MKIIHIKNDSPNRYASSIKQYLGIDLCEAEFIQMIFDHFLMEEQKNNFETKEELTFEKALENCKFYFYKDDLTIKEKNI